MSPHFESIKKILITSSTSFKLIYIYMRDLDKIHCENVLNSSIKFVRDGKRKGAHFMNSFRVISIKQNNETHWPMCMCLILFAHFHRKTNLYIISIFVIVVVSDATATTAPPLCGFTFNRLQIIPIFFFSKFNKCVCVTICA